jgi:hypothetical protein
MTILEPNRDQIEIFVEGLFRHCDCNGTVGVISLRAFYENGDKSSFRITNVALKGGLRFLMEAAEDDARRAANDPKPVVFCPPVATFAPTGKAREQDLLEAPALSVELDQHPRASLEGLERLLGFATLVVRSGGEWVNPTTGEVEDKLHAHWRLKEPARGADIAKLKRARRIATELVGGDTTNVPACHPIRWPGSWHRKNTPKLCEIVGTEHLDNELDLDLALEALEAVAPKPTGDGQDGPQQSIGQQGGTEAFDWSVAFSKIISGEQFHPVLVPLASSFAARAVPQVAAGGVLRALLNNTVTLDPERLRRRDVELSKLKETVKSGYDKFAATPTSGGLFDPWQEFIVPPFPLDVLPPVVQSFVDRRSTAIGCDPSAMAMSALASLSGAIHHRFRVKVQRNNDWYEHMRLWVLLVGRVTSKKTLIVNTTTKPLERYQAKIMRDYNARLRDYEAAKAAGDKEAQPPEPPVRYVVNDSTIEKLGDILSRSPRGILAKFDEVAGWIGALERYHGSNKGASADRAFWLQAWNGGHYVVDRIKRGETFIENLSASIIGGIQPTRLTEIHGLTSDGLLQRYAPVLMREPRRAQDIDCIEVTKAYEALVFELVELVPQRLYLADDAVEAMSALQDHLFKLEQVGEALAEGFQGYIGKLASYAGVLAMILWLSINPKEAVRLGAIGRQTVEKACRIIKDFLLPHAREFYSLGEGETDRLRKLASYVLTCGLDRIRLADLTNNVWDCRGKDVIEINQRVSPLVAGAWLLPTEPGPACRAWTVNRSAIDRQFAARMTTEREKKAALAQLMGAQRRI